LAEAAFVDVVACAEYERMKRAGFFSFDFVVYFAGESLRVEKNQILFERLSLRDYRAVRSEHHARPVEDEAVVPPHLVDHRYWNLLIAGDRDKHIAAQFALAQPEG